MAAVAQRMQLGHAQAGLFPGLACQCLLQRIGSRYHAAHQRIPHARMVGLVKGALLHPHAAIGRGADQVHGAGRHAQRAHGAAFDGADAFTPRIGYAQLLIAPWADTARSAHGIGKRIHGNGSIALSVGFQLPRTAAHRQPVRCGKPCPRGHALQHPRLYRTDLMAVHDQRHPWHERRALCVCSCRCQPCGRLRHAGLLCHSVIHHQSSVRMVEPVVLRASRSRCACCTSLSG